MTNRLVDFNACDSVIDNLNALEQAIDEICSVPKAVEIRRRKAVLLRR